VDLFHIKIFMKHNLLFNYMSYFNESPSWQEKITVRGVVVSGVLGAVFCVITHKLNMTVGVIPSLNVAAGLLRYFLIKTWTGVLSKLGIWTSPFTRKENEVSLVDSVQVGDNAKSNEDKIKEVVFMKDGIPFWVAASGYVGFTAISVRVIPVIFPSLKWYLVLISYIVAPVLAFLQFIWN
ncbi:hypothetical protein KI387_014200, partial [Taxus chinensis]